MKFGFSIEKQGTQTKEFNIIVQGFKSFYRKTKLNVKPLTILAGPNSSGKSSIFKPILLLKQTIDESYDPGALLLNGPNAQFNDADELLHRSGKISLQQFSIGIEMDNELFDIQFLKNEQGKPGFKVDEIAVTIKGELVKITENAGEKELESILNAEDDVMINFIKNKTNQIRHKIIVRRNRCFLDIEIHYEKEGKEVVRFASISFEGQNILKNMLYSLIHLPGLRGNPARNYPTTLVDYSFDDISFKGTFEKYVASIVNYWQENNKDMITALEEKMKLLKLGTSIQTKLVNDTQIAVLVGRFSHNTSEMDNIADVGLGVSQTLPVIVALLCAKPGQIVYIEQPEIHLHPNAQYNLAKLLIEAANRGVFVVIETHSSILIKGIQTLIAKKEILKDRVNLHWFNMGDDGISEIITAQIEEDGSFGDWPEDFDDVELNAETEYLNAVEKYGEET